MKTVQDDFLKSSEETLKNVQEKNKSAFDEFDAQIKIFDEKIVTKQQEDDEKIQYMQKQLVSTIDDNNKAISSLKIQMEEKLEKVEENYLKLQEKLIGKSNEPTVASVQQFCLKLQEKVKVQMTKLAQENREQKQEIKKMGQVQLKLQQKLEESNKEVDLSSVEQMCFDIEENMNMQISKLVQENKEQAQVIKKIDAEQSKLQEKINKNSQEKSVASIEQFCLKLQESVKIKIASLVQENKEQKQIIKKMEAENKKMQEKMAIMKDEQKVFYDDIEETVNKLVEKKINELRKANSSTSEKSTSNSIRKSNALEIIETSRIQPKKTAKNQTASTRKKDTIEIISNRKVSAEPIESKSVIRKKKNGGTTQILGFFDSEDDLY